MTGIDNLIICNPYKVPSKHWRYDRTKRKFDLVPGRRPAGFLIASQDSKSFDDPGEFKELGLVNNIRDRVDSWRERGYPNITGITKQLLEFWNDETKREDRLFFCQLEAIETLIWLVEGPDSDKQGIDVPSDGGEFQRLCCKMATGTGKTIVMAMLIAWQILNKITYPRDTRFSKNVLIMAPGLTVKSRLQVLYPTDPNNFYEQFNLVPESLLDRLYRGNLIIHNWHTLMPETDAPRSVVKLGKESNTVFSKRILNHDLKNILVINDEAHHAYRASTDQAKKISNRDLERDKRWIEGLDKIHNARNIVHCFDFSATPFIPSGKNVSEDTLFEWIVSDFSLNDAIESGLTKTPRIAIRDDSGKFTKEYRSRFYHIYKDDEVKPDLNRNSKPHEELPDLVSNAYKILGQDWIETKKLWDEKGSKIPPVMITVCNKTNAAARVTYSFEKNRFDLPELSVPEYLLHIDSTTIDKAESKSAIDISSTKLEDNLRVKVDTVGKEGEVGEQIRNIVAVQMLSEGWDARNVTHIMGLRAFSSQLLCEQVVGRGLRRTSYEIDPETQLFSPEYVNVFGVPFTFLPHEGGDGTPPPPTAPTTSIFPDPEKIQHEISWPNIERIDIDYTTKLEVDWSKTSNIELYSSGTATSVDVADVIEGKPHTDKMTNISLHKQERLQRIIFLAAKHVYEEMRPNWKGNKELLLIQIVKLVEEFIHLDKIIVTDVIHDEKRKRMTILFNMQKIVSHVCKSIKDNNIDSRRIHLNSKKPIKSTSDMRPWSTKKPAEYTTKSHINMAVYDSTWEMSTGQELERNKSVVSWVRNARIGFNIKYLFNGITHDYYPDFMIRLKNNITLVLEIKGKDDAQNKEKRKYLAEWIDIVNATGVYGTWSWDVAFSPGEVRGIIAKHSSSSVSANEYTRCPKCHKSAESRQDIERDFGFRNIDGIIRPQSWCRSCRRSNV